MDAAIADGATIDEIADLIRGEGGACSRSAVGRYTKNVRDLIRQQQETDRANEMWVRALGERAQGRAGLILIETLRTMTLSTMAELSQRETPPTPEELGRLALVLKRIEGTDKLRLEREQAAAKAAARAAPGAGQAAGQAPPRKGLSPEAVAAIREAIEGRPRAPERAVTSAPVDPWNPAESHLIPLNPGESRPENVSDVSFFKSLNGGRSLRSLAYAPSGAARSRALRTCGPAHLSATASPVPTCRSRAVRAASQPGPPLPVLSRLVHFPQRRALRTCGPVHLNATASPVPTWRSRAVRAALQPGPAAVRNSPPKARGAPCHVMAGLARTGSGYPAIHRAAHPSRGMTEGDARNKSGHDEVGGPVGWIASPSMQTATAHSPSPPLRDKKWLAERVGVRWGKLFTNRSGASCARARGRAARSRVLRTCGPAHFPLSPLRPLGPEKEKGADTAFGPPPPFSGEGDRGSWAGLPSGPAFEGYEREEARAGYRRYDPPGASRRGPSLTQRTMADAGACSADVSSRVHKWIERIVPYLSLKRASRALVAGSGACSGLIAVHEASVVGA